MDDLRAGIAGGEGCIRTVPGEGLGPEFEADALTLPLEAETEFMLAYAVSNDDSRIPDLHDTQPGFCPADNSSDYWTGTGWPPAGPLLPVNGFPAISAATPQSGGRIM